MIQVGYVIVVVEPDGPYYTNPWEIYNKSELMFCPLHAIYKGTNKLLIDLGFNVVFRTLRLPSRLYRPTLSLSY